MSTYHYVGEDGYLHVAGTDWTVNGPQQFDRVAIYDRPSREQFEAIARRLESDARRAACRCGSPLFCRCSSPLLAYKRPLRVDRTLPTLPAVSHANRPRNAAIRPI